MMDVLERVLESRIRSQVVINDMKFGFRPGCSTTDAIYILQQMQEKHFIRKKKIYFAFIDYEKAFNWVHHSVIWLAMSTFGID